MYDFIKGSVLRYESKNNLLILDTGHLGYEVFVPNTIQIEEKKVYTLYTHFVVSENNMSLYAFQNRLERDVFRLLITVSGLGPKMALRILSVQEAKPLLELISLEKTTALSTVKGFGAKTASKTVLELKKKAQQMLIDLGEYGEKKQDSSLQFSLKNDLVRALKDLGYKEAESLLASEEALKMLPKDSSLEEALSLTLKQIGEKGLS